MRFLIFLSVLLTSYISQADIIFSPAIGYTTDKQEVDGTTTVDTARKAYDFRLGWTHNSGLYLGGLYTMTNTTSGDDEDKMTGFGPTLGYVHSYGFYALFTYFVSAEYKTDTSKYVDGMGPQIDIGWVFPLTGNFYIGPQMSYRSVGYDKVEVSGTSVATDTTHSNISPYLTLWFKF